MSTSTAKEARTRTQGGVPQRRPFLDRIDEDSLRAIRWVKTKAATRTQIKTMRDNIILQCPECKRRNYHTTKNKRKTTERLEKSKYCRYCRKHTAHKETK